MPDYKPIDNGSFSTGLVTGLCFILVFLLGYWIGSSGYKIELQRPQENILRPGEVIQ